MVRTRISGVLTQWTDEGNVTILPLRKYDTLTQTEVIEILTADSRAVLTALQRPTAKSKITVDCHNVLNRLPGSTLIYLRREKVEPHG